LKFVPHHRNRDIAMAVRHTAFFDLPVQRFESAREPRRGASCHDVVAGFNTLPLCRETPEFKYLRVVKGVENSMFLWPSAAAKSGHR
jgi:hypothetical protein